MTGRILAIAFVVAVALGVVLSALVRVLFTHVFDGLTMLGAQIVIIIIVAACLGFFDKAVQR